MPIKLCLEPRCPNEAEIRGRCRAHHRERERGRNRVRTKDGRERNRFYARKRWRMTRRRKLFLEPLCEYVEANGERCRFIAEHVHHRIDLADGGAEYNLDNLMSICKRHHSKITLEHRHPGGGSGERFVDRA